MISDELWEKLEKEYSAAGYTDTRIIIDIAPLVRLDLKVEAIKNLLKKQPQIIVNKFGYYSVGPIYSSQGQKIIEEIMRILFEKDELTPFATIDDPKADSMTKADQE